MRGNALPSRRKRTFVAVSKRFWRVAAKLAAGFQARTSSTLRFETAACPQPPLAALRWSLGSGARRVICVDMHSCPLAVPAPELACRAHVAVNYTECARCPTPFQFSTSKS